MLSLSSMRWSLALPLVLAACEGVPPGAPAADLGAPADAAALPPHDGGQGGFLRIVALDDETGLPLPARALIQAVPPTPAIPFDVSPKTGMSVNGNFGVRLAPGVLGAPEGVLLVAGDGAFDVRPGTYDVFVTRGPEWEAHQQRVTVDGKANVVVTAPLRRSVDTGGWLAADLHIHTGRSYDSQLPVDDRVVSEVAVGVELLVVTDHNVLSDLQPEVELFGYDKLARSITGDEFNFLEGHGGAYPMPYDGSMPFGGTWENGLDWTQVKDVSATKLFDWLHAFPTRPAVTVNHPRLPPDLGYFINLKQFGPSGWAPPSALPAAGKFDGLEVLNGYWDGPEQVAELMRDWFFLLNSGYRVTALGSSDTHRLSGTKAGFPRTWLGMPSEDPSQIVGSDVADAVKGGRAVASNGPFVTFTVGGKPIGALAPSGSGTVTVEVTADAPAWIALDHLRVWVDGALAKEIAVPAGAQRPRLHQTLTLPVPAGDGWIAVTASGDQPLPSGLLGDPAMPYLPIAIANPVYLDGDGDGAWTPHIAQPDPGPVGMPLPPEGFNWTGHQVPIDCEPPLWTDPAKFVRP